MHKSECVKYGNIAESLFIVKCSQKDIPVFKNQNAVGEIDYIIIFNNNLLRFQIKSTLNPVKHKVYNISTKRNGNLLYKNVDYIAAYLHELNEWYIIPFDIIGGKQAISININNNIYESFKENWELDVIKTPEEVDDNNISKRNEAIELFKNGIEKGEIARRLEFHYSVINRWLREAGYGLRNLNAPEEKLRELYSVGKNMKEIAIELNMSLWTIRNLFRKYNITVRVNNTPKEKRGN